VGVGVGEPPPPTIVAPRKARTSAMGLAIELVAPAPPQLPSPAKTRPTARGLLSVSSTTKEPESPQSSKLPPLLAITICPVEVSVNEAGPLHEPSYSTWKTPLSPMMKLWV